MSNAVITPEVLSDPLEVVGQAVEVDEGLSSLRIYLDRDIRKNGEVSIPSLSPHADHEAHETLNSANLYFRDLGRTGLLNASEEVELAKRIEAGLYAEHKLAEGSVSSDLELCTDLETVAQEGRDAMRLLIESNLRLVVTIAGRYVRRSKLPFLDIIQNGNMGLMRGAEKYDYAKGYKFSTYVVWWIRQAIVRDGGEQSWIIRLPAGQLEQLTAISRIREELLTKLDREPSSEEWARTAGMSEERLRELVQWNKPVASLDVPLATDSEESVGDMVPCIEQGYRNVEVESSDDADVALEQAVEIALGCLTEREGGVIELLYGLRGEIHTKAQISRLIETSAQNVGYIEKRALEKLRQHGSYLLDVFKEHAARNA